MTAEAAPGRPRLGSLIQRSRAWRKARTRAAEYIRDPKRLKSLLDRADQKSRRGAGGWVAEIWGYLTAMMRLVSAYWKGTFRDVSLEHLLTIVAVIVYFIMPVDVIPDWLPGVGFIDDAYVVSLALRTVKNALENFMRWEQTAGRSDRTEPIPLPRSSAIDRV